MKARKAEEAAEAQRRAMLEEARRIAHEAMQQEEAQRRRDQEEAERQRQIKVRACLWEDVRLDEWKAEILSGR